jgi:hypothetical protein
MNGKAEVRFRTLFERVRAMLMDANLPKQCGGFAVEYEQTPYEMWYKRQFDYDTLKTFGCIGYAHVTKTHRKAMNETDPDNTTSKTLDNRGTCGIFVGFSELRKAWKLINCRTMTHAWLYSTKLQLMKHLRSKEKNSLLNNNLQNSTLTTTPSMQLSLQTFYSTKSIIGYFKSLQRESVIEP